MSSPQTVAPVRGNRVSPRITGRGIQIALGVIWLLAGLLQFQSYMYSHDFVTQVLEASAVGQPSFIGGPITAIAHFYGHDLTLWNTLAAEIQSAIGLGLILSRRTVRPALALSFAWSVVVWWLGEGFGMLSSNTEPSALMGAPGAVIIYGLIGLAVWPRRDPARAPAAPAELRASGAVPARPGVADDDQINDRVAGCAWSALWLVSAVLWCLNVNRSKNALHDMLVGMASGSPHWLASWQSSVARSTAGHGAVIALVLAGISVVVALGVFSPALRLPVLAVGVVISLAYWVLGQSLGGPFWVGNATDVNAAPLFILLGCALVPGGLHRSVAQRTPRPIPGRRAHEPAREPAVSV